MQRSLRRTRKKRRSNRGWTKTKSVAPRTKRGAQSQKRAFKALAKTRRDELSFSAAARAEHVSLRTALKYVGEYLRRRRSKGGRVRYVPIKSDRAVRNMFVLTPLGHVAIKVRGSRDASLIGKHSAAVNKFLRTGDESVLAPFRDKRVAGRELITNPQLLSKLADAGALRLDDLYAVPTGAA
jgi:hypothetical protein